MFIQLVIPAFFAGLLTFLAPCTLPLVPGFLAFMGNGKNRLWNTLWYVLGFSLVFIVLGTLFSVVGTSLADYRYWLGRMGGVIIVFFGLFLLGFSRAPLMQWLNTDKLIHVQTILQPGRPISSFVFGVTFAFGWTPCVGPILGSILLLAATSTTILQGTVLLGVFSLGLAVPFFLLAAGMDSVQVRLKKVYRFLPVIQKIGGVFLIGMGLLLALDKMNLWIGYVYRVLSVLHYDQLVQYL